MRICDVCNEHWQLRVDAQPIDTPIGSLDLCSYHKKQLEENLKLATNILRWADKPPNDRSQDWIDRLVPQRNPDTIPNPERS